MAQSTKVFMNEGSQAVRLPANFHFDCDEVFIRRDEITGDIVISRKPDSWDGFFDLLDSVEVPDDFMLERSPV